MRLLRAVDSSLKAIDNISYTSTNTLNDKLITNLAYAHLILKEKRYSFEKIVYPKDHDSILLTFEAIALKAKGADNLLAVEFDIATNLLAHKAKDGVRKRECQNGDNHNETTLRVDQHRKGLRRWNMRHPSERHQIDDT